MIEDEIKIIRRIRHEMSEEFNHDLNRLVAYLQTVEQELKRSGRFRFASSEETTTPKKAAASLPGGTVESNP